MFAFLIAFVSKCRHYFVKQGGQRVCTMVRSNPVTAGKCSFPEHHVSARSGIGLFAAVVLAVIVWRARHLILELLTIAGITVLALAAVAVVVLVIRHRRHLGRIRQFRARPPRWLRHLPRALWAGMRWHHTARNLGLAAPDKHRQGAVRHPRALILPHSHGITARVKTVPGTGRAELEAMAEHLANAWKCQRVSVSQPKPGRLVVRGLKRDVLLEPLTLADAPPADPARPFRVWLGRDEHGATAG